MSCFHKTKNADIILESHIDLLLLFKIIQKKLTLSRYVIKNATYESVSINK